ncbi:unnamed protein product [Cylicostephanus goldi]|uniref:Beta-lactamase-related domain-containing protein n=1 Tax=Cylicostephanus goldi TaxID=71465 RepID=A0A3P7MKE8_CYLGO|nr:unnamed protein product [Cylicostephanus goldi]
MISFGDTDPFEVENKMTGNPIAGHGGYGCQEVNFDTTNGVVISYVTNGLKLGMYEDCPTYSRLQRAVYDVIQKSRS